MRDRLQLWLVLGLMAVAGLADAGSRAQRRALEEMQTAYAAAIRWSDFDTVAQMVDPEYRRAHPQTDLENARYQQVQVSGYRELRVAEGADGSVVREAEIRVINRNTQAERSVRCSEVWRWDPQRKQWWLANGPPDLWQGQ